MRRKRKVIDLRPYFSRALNYIKESRNYIYFIVAVFAASALVGFFLAPELRFIDSLLEEIINRTSGLGTEELTVFIFSNNLQSAFMGLFFGIALGIFSVGNALINGTVIGYVFSRVYDVSGFMDFWRILPHGIFELPAIFISLGLGVKLGMFVFSKHPGKELKRMLADSAIAFLLVVVPLLVIAAIIEGLLISLG